jgi:ribosomal-protein-alanine N-acetyltransferase
VSNFDIATCHFETNRLCVAPWAPMLTEKNWTRLKAMLETLLTPAVLAHLPPPMQLGSETSALDLWIKERDQESNVLYIEDRNTDTFIGLLILAIFPDETNRLTIRLGYFLVEETWGKGLATELVRGFVNWCHAQQCDIQLLGGVETGNPASALVLKKAGFQLDLAMSSSETEIYQLNL